LTENGNLNIGQGRLIPSTPWEGPWNALAEWFGVSSQNMNAVLPNKPYFEGVNIFSKADMFE
jgi:cullin-associated NEDD8-dissociated protein 1